MYGYLILHLFTVIAVHFALEDVSEPDLLSTGLLSKLQEKNKSGW